MSRDTWSGCSAAYSITMVAANSTARTANRSSPSRPTTASISRTKAAADTSDASRAERPVPRKSKRTRVMPAPMMVSNPARRIGCSHSIWMWLGSVCIQMRGGPLPAVVYAMLTPSLVLTYCTGGGVILRASLPPTPASSPPLPSAPVRRGPRTARQPMSAPASAPSPIPVLHPLPTAPRCVRRC